ncbi:MAG: hypothetical protein ACTSSJ_00650 [Candidatus Odinarchaeia archaeon]
MLRKSDKQPTDKNPIGIKLEIIKTPKGDVPTINTIKDIVNGLNIINSEVNSLEVNLADFISNFKAELNALRKLMAEQTIMIEKLNENIKIFEELPATIESLSEMLDNKIKILENKFEAHRKSIEEKIYVVLSKMAEAVGIKLSKK